jgi:hypothetical protein
MAYSAQRNSLKLGMLACVYIYIYIYVYVYVYDYIPKTEVDEDFKKRYTYI